MCHASSPISMNACPDNFSVPCNDVDDPLGAILKMTSSVPSYWLSQNFIKIESYNDGGQHHALKGRFRRL